MASSTLVASPLTPAITPFISATFENLKTTASNATSYLNPSPSNLLMALPRLAHRMGSYWFSNMQEIVEDTIGVAMRRRDIPLATSRGGAAAQVAAGILSEAQAAAGAANGGPQGGASRFVTTLSFQNVRGFGGMFAYLTSRWALWCVLMAVVLNRTHIYASARRRLHMHWHLRLAIRIIPVVLFANQVVQILQAMRCQCSPDYTTMKYGDSSVRHDVDFATAGGVLYQISSSLMFWQTDRESCLSSGLLPAPLTKSESEAATSGLAEWGGSLALLWPLFKTFCLSQFLETLSCALEGRTVQAETGMTLFEHSLAFAEAEAMISAELGIGPFAHSKEAQADTSDAGLQASALAVSIVQRRFTIMDHVNTPPEVLLIGLISGLSHLTSNTLAIFKLQAKYRLISTGFFGLCFMSAFLWSFYSFSPGIDGNVGILRFPTVCIVGFIPHLLILMGIAICASIYFLALVIVAFAPPEGVPRPRNLRERFKIAHENLQVNMQVSNIRIHMYEDFYTTLLKLGFMALTAASEAVYLNEGRPVTIRRRTWLEEDRLSEYQRKRDEYLGIPPELREDSSNLVAEGIGLTSTPGSSAPTGYRSGYASERRMEKLGRSSSMGLLRSRGDGVGASERSGRWLLAYGFFKGIFWLLCGWCAISILKTLRSAGIRFSPAWLRELAQRDKLNAQITSTSALSGDDPVLDFWLVSQDGMLTLPSDTNVDVEAEMRKRMQASAEGWSIIDEASLDTRMYGWFLHNGWWGERDASGDYNPSTASDDDEDDTTSLISTNASFSPSLSSGQQTPTPSSPQPLPDSTLDAAHLARLLDPHSLSDRTEARLLAHHLTSDRTVTRSQYTRAQNLSRSRVLTAGHHPTAGTSRLSPEEEEELLERLIIAKRSVSSQATTGAWADGAAGLGDTGPFCVVCQSTPRTVLVWPYRNDPGGRWAELRSQTIMRIGNPSESTLVYLRAAVKGLAFAEHYYGVKASIVSQEEEPARTYRERLSKIYWMSVSELARDCNVLQNKNISENFILETLGSGEHRYFACGIVNDLEHRFMSHGSCTKVIIPHPDFSPLILVVLRADMQFNLWSIMK
ncbi:MAG: hypothetical protein M1814_006013 [Vezdaea aestivalis]|nr:MAG: hypothetical protein M1814_006013 [Vezdaea aestivalis]